MKWHGERRAVEPLYRRGIPVVTGEAGSGIAAFEEGTTGAGGFAAAPETTGFEGCLAVGATALPVPLALDPPNEFTD